ncbi:MAG: LytTR family transcriptional regulator DNA-binding domain-containing protein [Ardenticatenales bacterium]|nr:LytTR family transcriptional regulator DNA-binding domain-containing protein [Ardenticatenales bacterium]
MIQIEKLQKVIDGRVVLEIDSLAVAAGEMAALVGAPGSGKGELLALLTGRLGPTSGQVRLAGVDPAAARPVFSQQVGVLFGEDGLYATRTPRANLAFHARLRGLPAGRVDEILAQVGLADHANSKFSQLSASLRRRLAFGVALLHQPTILLLAEPFARCDEASITLLSELIRTFATDGGAVLILADTDAHLTRLCDTLYELEQGRIVAQRQPQTEAAGTALPFKIPVKLEGRVALINPADILYVLAEEGRTLLQTHTERLPTQFTMTELEERLARSGFFRAHRAYLVNLQHVTEVIPFTRSSFSLRLNDEEGSQIPLSRDAARELRELLDY